MSSDRSILVLNSGSSSIKFALFGAEAELPRLLAGSLDRIGLSGGRFRAHDIRGENIIDDVCDLVDHDAALSVLLPAIEKHLARHPITAAGHRVVHGGALYLDHQTVTAEMMSLLSETAHLAPLHLPGNVAGMEALRRTRSDITQIACFDTTFHQSMPRIAQLTGLPRELFDEGIRRFGFHGLSYEYVVDALREAGVAVEAERIVIAHLGNGASMCAVQGGRSIETTMGYSTLPGLLMGTRPGDVDPGIILHLLQRKGLTTEQVGSLLYERSGLLGVSDLTSDMRELLSHSHESAVNEAIELFCYRARYHLAALTAVLGGVDRVVFTGGIGAHAAPICAKICQGLEYLGIFLEPAANTAGLDIVSRPGSRVIVQAMLSDEERVAARHVWRWIAGISSRPTTMAYRTD